MTAPSAVGPGSVESVPDGVLVIDKPMGPTSHDVVALIETLRSAVGSLDHSAGDVASSMESQRAAAAEIAQNIERAAQETGTVSDALTLVTTTFNEVSSGSEGIVQSIAELETEVRALKDAECPVYSVLVPMYKEPEVLPILGAALICPQWPEAAAKEIRRVGSHPPLQIVGQSVPLPLFVKQNVFGSSGSPSVSMWKCGPNGSPPVGAVAEIVAKTEALCRNRPGFAMRTAAAVGLVIQQRAGARRIRQLAQRRTHHALVLAAGVEVGRRVDAEIDDIRMRDRRGHGARHRRIGTVADAHRDVAAHEGAASDFAADQAAPFRFAIGARDGADGDAELIGELAMSGKAIAGRKPAAADIGGQRIRNRQIARAAMTAKVGDPNCHEDNVCVDCAQCQ